MSRSDRSPPTQAPKAPIETEPGRPSARSRWVAGLLLALGAGFAVLPSACGDGVTPGLEPQAGLSALVFLRRAPPGHAGDLTSTPEIRTGGALLQLTPVALRGQLDPLLEVPGGDVSGLDVSPDGRQALLAVRTSPADRFHILIVELAAAGKPNACLTPSGDLGPSCRQLTFGPADDREPFFLPDGRIGFERQDPQGAFDDGERARGRMLMAMNADGSGMVPLVAEAGPFLGARSLRNGWVHALQASRSSDRLVVRRILVDPSAARAPRPLPTLAQGVGLPWQPVEDESGDLLAVCLPAQGTWEAGSLCRCQRREDIDCAVWEARLPGIPMGPGCSPGGRIQAGFPLDSQRFLVSFARTDLGCMNATDEANSRVPDFALAVVEAGTRQTTPLFNTPALADIDPRPVRPHSLLDSGITLPTRPDLGCDRPFVTLEGFVGPERLDQGAVAIRVTRVLSGADVPWSPEVHGRQPAAILGADTNGDGKADVWKAPVQPDGSFRLEAPARNPLRLQVLDAYGSAIASDALIQGGPPCSVRRCGACHANRGEAAGFPESQAAGQPVLRFQQERAVAFRRDLQPLLTRSCAVAGCHNSLTRAGNTAIFRNGQWELRGLNLSDAPSGRTNLAYQELLQRSQAWDDLSGLLVMNDTVFVTAGRAQSSRLVQRLGAPCQGNCSGKPNWAPWGVEASASHPEDVGFSLTPQERQALIEWVDLGAPYWAPGLSPP